LASTGTARLEDGVAARHQALKELPASASRSNAPCHWQPGYRNGPLAERPSDVATAQKAIHQMDLELKTMRDGSDPISAAHYQAALSKYPRFSID
jgi:hypothetical protein